MARIGGVNIPNHQHADVALTAIYGIGRSRARVICAAAGIATNTKIKDLSDSEMDKLREQAYREGVKPLRISGALKVAAGITTVDEVMKVAPPMHDRRGGQR